MSTEYPEGHMAEVVPFPRRPVEDVDPLAELNDKVMAAFHVLHDLIDQKIQLERELGIREAS